MFLLLLFLFNVYFNRMVKLVTVVKNMIAMEEQTQTMSVTCHAQAAMIKFVEVATGIVYIKVSMCHCNTVQLVHNFIICTYCVQDCVHYLLDLPQQQNRGHGGRVVTLSPPTSEAGVRSP